MNANIRHSDIISELEYLRQTGALSKLSRSIYEGKITRENVADAKVDEHIVYRFIDSILLTKIYSVRDAYNDMGKVVTSKVVELAKYRLEHLSSDGGAISAYVGNVLLSFQRMANYNDMIFKRYPKHIAENRVYYMSHKMYKYYPEAALVLGYITRDYYCMIYPDAKNILKLYDDLEKSIRENKPLSQEKISTISNKSNDTDIYEKIMVSMPGEDFADDKLKFSAAVINIEKIRIAKAAYEFCDEKLDDNAVALAVDTAVLHFNKGVDITTSSVEDILAYTDICQKIESQSNDVENKLADLYTQYPDIAYAMGDIDAEMYKLIYLSGSDIIYILNSINNALINSL